MLKIILKKIFSESFIWWLVRKKEIINLYKIQLIKSNNFLIVLSLLFNKKYLNEHKSFLEGSFIYRKSLISSQLNVHFLRRNIHRIEKGMIMEPRRDVFALRFILETVSAYVLLQSEDNTRSECKWGNDVLTEYFKIVISQNKSFLKAKQLFMSNKPILLNGLNNSEIPYQLKDNNIIKYNDFFKFNLNRKSVRWFKDEQVSDAIFNKALGIAALAPSSCNRSPFKYMISNKNKKLTTMIADISAGTAGWSHNIPAIVVLLGRQRSFSNDANRHSIYVDGTLSVMPFILALETLGLKTCIINWADIPKREKAMTKILKLEKDEKVILSIAVGYGAVKSKVAYSKRKTNNEISKFIS